MKIALIGLGQSLRGDDGVGLAAVRLWQAVYIHTSRDPRLRVELSELPGLALLDMLQGARFVVLVDAVNSGDQPPMIVPVVMSDLAL